MVFARLLLGVSCVALFSACGGGTAGSPPAGAVAAPANAKPTAGPAGFAAVSFSIALPAHGSASTTRAPAFIPAATTTVTVAVDGSTPMSFACSGSVCSGTFQAPAGASDAFTFTATDSQAHALAESTFTQTIAANGVNALNVALEGVVDHATLSLSAAGLSSATTGTVTVTATAFDADGDLITGMYFVPLTLAVIGDTTGSISAGSPITNSTATGTITYTPAAATIYTENRVAIAQSSSTETTAQRSVPLEVGRTLYTWTSADTVVGFAPGSTTPTRAVNIGSTLSSVSSITCDGTNLYLDDVGGTTVYGIAPTATTAVAYSSDAYAPVWVVANGGRAPSTQAEFFLSNNANNGLSGYAGAMSGPPFPLPPDSIAYSSSGGGPAGSSSAVMDASGNAYSASYNVNTDAGGYKVFNNTLSTLIASAVDTTTAYGSDMIAIDTTVNPPRIYTEEDNANYQPEIAEYDNFASSPAYISSDSADVGIFVDASGNLYTSALASLPTSAVARRAAALTRTRPQARRRTESYFATYFDVYPPGGLAGMPAYTIAGNSLVFDSEGYVYANQYSGSIEEFAPGSASLVTTYAGTTYGLPSQGQYEFGTFCR
jgi:hypothetical protein